MKGLFQCPPRATPWVYKVYSKTPCKGKSFSYTKLLPLQGDKLAPMITQGVALG